MGNSLIIPNLHTIHAKMPLHEVADKINLIGLKYNTIENLNWNNFPYKPEVKFVIAQLNGGLFLTFSVKEKAIRGLITTNNGAVCDDSCVEFFIDPFSDGAYYNFEFNCIGTIHLGYGPTRFKREMATSKILNEIQRLPSIGNKPLSIQGKEYIWLLHVLIPYSAFYKHNIQSLEGQDTCRGNFYKCGDKTPVPHYLSWNPINTLTPDFHQSDFFGSIYFEK